MLVLSYFSNKDVTYVSGFSFFGVAMEAKILVNMNLIRNVRNTCQM